MCSFENKFLFSSFMTPLLLVLISCTQDAPLQTKQPTIRPVKLITLGQANTPQTRRYPGVINAAKSSTLAFQVGGLVQELLVIDAQEVTQGDVIAKLNPQDYQSNVDSAKAQFRNAEDEYQRVARLAKKDAIARNVLEQHKSQRDIAKAKFNSANKALNDTILKAPFSGVIAKVAIEYLQVVQAGEKIVTLITKQGKDAFEATINLPASIIAKSPTKKNKSAFVILDASPQNRIPATFKEAELEADAISQTYKITFSFTPPNDLIILPGMNATVVLSSTMDTAEQNNNIAVPLTAVMSDGEHQYVWLVNNETMTVSKRTITIKEGIGENLIVTEGLTVDETIAGAGGAYLAEGMKVRPWKH